MLRKYRNVDKTRRREAARPWVISIVLEESSCCVWKCLKEFCIELIQCTLNKSVKHLGHVVPGDHISQALWCLFYVITLVFYSEAQSDH